MIISKPDEYTGMCVHQKGSAVIDIQEGDMEICISTRGPNGSIRLDTTEVDAVIAFLTCARAKMNSTKPQKST
jgi:hypothetical protein